MKESYRLSEFKTKPGYDFVFAAREGSMNVDSMNEMIHITDRLFGRAGLFLVSRNKKL